MQISKVLLQSSRVEQSVVDEVLQLKPSLAHLNTPKESKASAAAAAVAAQDAATNDMMAVTVRKRGVGGSLSWGRVGWWGGGGWGLHP